MISPFLDRLARSPILCDGAMGTMLHWRGVPFGRCFDELNLSEPNLVQEIHREYIRAGAEIIETNTYGANRLKLAVYGLEKKTRDINFWGVKIAREAREIMGEPVFLAGAVGPTSTHWRKLEGTDPGQIRAAFREQIDALLEAGADLLILETFTDLAELVEAVQAAKGTSELPIVAQMTFDEECRTLSGHSPEEVVPRLQELGVAAIGINCGVGPQIALDVVERMATVATTPLSAQPNAGFPARLEGRYFYISSPEYFGEHVPRLVNAGVRILGGCCGTSPRHIQAMRDVMTTITGSRPTTVALSSGVTSLPEPPSLPAEPTTAPTHLAQKLAQGKFVISVELDPPRGVNPTKMLQGAAMLKQEGVDCINIGDSPLARVRMSCLALAVLIQQKVGMETIIHFTTRDRNLMALQSELIGAHALGIRNVIALTGDPPRIGDYPNATGVWDVDSIGLVAILKRLNQGLDWAGTSIGTPTSFFVAVAVSPEAEEPEREMERFRRKLEAGADFVMSQPLYDIETLERFLDRYGPLPVPFVLGVLPLQSSKQTEFLHNEVPGIRIPDRVRQRMRDAGEKGMEEGLAIALEFLEKAKSLVSGVYLMPSFGRYEMVRELAKAIR